MAKPVFPVIEEGVTYNPGDLKESLGHLWYEGVENDINRRMIKSLDDLRRVKGGSIASRALKGAANIARGIKTDRDGNAIGRLPAAENKTSLQRTIANIPQSKGQSLNKSVNEFLKNLISGNYGLLGMAKNIYQGRGDTEMRDETPINQSNINTISNNQLLEDEDDGLNLFGKPGKYRKHSDLTDEQIKTLEQARGIGMRGLVHILNNLANPLPQLPISPLQQQATGISNSLAGPLLLSLLNQPSPSSFAPMYASQLAQQQGPGLSDMLGSLAAPALQAALPYIGSLFNRQG